VTTPLWRKHSISDISDRVVEGIKQLETALDEHITQGSPCADTHSSDEIVSADQNESALAFQAFLNDVKRITHVV